MQLHPPIINMKKPDSYLKSLDSRNDYYRGVGEQAAIYTFTRKLSHKKLSSLISPGKIASTEDLRDLRKQGLELDSLLSPQTRDISHLKDKLSLLTPRHPDLPSNITEVKRLVEASDFLGNPINKHGDPLPISCRKSFCINNNGKQTLMEVPSIDKLFLGAPSGRQECSNLKKWFESMKDTYCISEDSEENRRILYNMCSKELIRQVTVQCIERGELLHQVLEYFATSYEKIKESLAQSQRNSESLKKYMQDKLKEKEEQLTSQIQRLTNSKELLLETLEDEKAKNFKLSEEIFLKDHKIENLISRVGNDEDNSLRAVKTIRQRGSVYGGLSSMSASPKYSFTSKILSMASKSELSISSDQETQTENPYKIRRFNRRKLTKKNTIESPSKEPPESKDPSSERKFFPLIEISQDEAEVLNLENPPEPGPSDLLIHTNSSYLNTDTIMEEPSCSELEESLYSKDPIAVEIETQTDEILQQGPLSGRNFSEEELNLFCQWIDEQKRNAGDDEPREKLKVFPRFSVISFEESPVRTDKVEALEGESSSGESFEVTPERAIGKKNTLDLQEGYSEVYSLEDKESGEGNELEIREENKDKEILKRGRRTMKGGEEVGEKELIHRRGNSVHAQDNTKITMKESAYSQEYISKVSFKDSLKTFENNKAKSEEKNPLHTQENYPKTSKEHPNSRGNASKSPRKHSVQESSAKIVSLKSFAANKKLNIPFHEKINESPVESELHELELLVAKKQQELSLLDKQILEKHSELSRISHPAVLKKPKTRGLSILIDLPLASSHSEGQNLKDSISQKSNSSESIGSIEDKDSISINPNLNQKLLQRKSEVLLINKLEKSLCKDPLNKSMTHLLSPTRTLSEERRRACVRTVYDLDGRKISIRDGNSSAVLNVSGDESIDDEFLKEETMKNTKRTIVPVTEVAEFNFKHRSTSKDVVKKNSIAASIIIKIANMKFTRVKKRATLSKKAVSKLISALYFSYSSKEDYSEPLIDFVYDEFSQKFGFKKVITKKFIEFISSMIVLQDSRKSKTFLRFISAGAIINQSNFSSEALSFYLSALNFMINSKIGLGNFDDSNDKVMLPLTRAVECIKEHLDSLDKSLVARTVSAIEHKAVPDHRKINQSGMVENEFVLETLAELYENVKNKGESDEREKASSKAING